MQNGAPGAVPADVPQGHREDVDDAHRDAKVRSGGRICDVAPTMLQLMGIPIPAAMTGVRGMFRLTGGVLSVATIVLALTFFPDRGQGLSAIFLFLSVAVLLAVPLALMVPDLAGERYRSARRPEDVAPPAPAPPGARPRNSPRPPR